MIDETDFNFRRFTPQCLIIVLYDMQKQQKYYSFGSEFKVVCSYS